MSLNDIKKVGEIKNTSCIGGIEDIENIEILANLKNLDYLKGIEDINKITPNIEVKEEQLAQINNEEVIELVQAGKTIIESADKIVEIISENVESKENIEAAVEVVYNEDSHHNKNIFINSIKKLGVTELLENLKKISKQKKLEDIEKIENVEKVEDIDEEFINHLKPRIFRSKLNELNNREAPSTIQKLFKYTKKSHKFNNFQKFCRALKISHLKFKYKNIEFFEWHNTEESEKLLLQWIKNINTNWSLKYKEHEKTVYNNIPLMHKKRLLYIDPYGYIESGTTLYKIKLYKVDDEDKYLVKLMD